jgi:hypothetical protein
MGKNIEPGVSSVAAKKREGQGRAGKRRREMAE